MHYEAEYLNSAYDEEHGVPNLVSKSLQTTRRFDALKLWMTIESLGEELYGSMIDHGVKLTREVADYIKATDGLELLVEPQFASVLFRVVPEGYPVEFIDFYYILFLLKVCIRRRGYAQNMHIFKKQK